MNTQTETTTGTEMTTDSQDPEIRVMSQEKPDGSIDCEADPEPITWGVDQSSLPSEDGGLRLIASKDEVAIGEEITFTMINRSDESEYTSQQSHFNIVRRNGEASQWEPVYYTPRLTPWTDLGWEIYPGGGFRWPFTVSQEGLERDPKGAPPYFVCGPITPGEYRFVFFGEELGVAFTVTDQ
jgi:hypothetical protein